MADAVTWMPRVTAEAKKGPACGNKFNPMEFGVDGIRRALIGSGKVMGCVDWFR